MLPGIFPPLDRKLPMQAARDVGAAAAALSDSLGPPVTAVAVPEAEWATRFCAPSRPERSVGGGLTVFETRRGSTTLCEALEDMVLRSGDTTMKMSLKQKGGSRPPPVLADPLERVSQVLQGWPGLVDATRWHVSRNRQVDSADLSVGDQELGHLHPEGEVRLARTSH